jgi:pimeloyl-ACP methyl ester carboxylesterase
LPFATAPDGSRIAFDDTGGAGEPLLLVSGQGLDRTMWDALRPLLGQSFRILRFDHRGTGDSDKPEAPPYSTRGFAADAVAVLDAAGVARAHAFGFSMGGRVSQWLAIDHPGRIGALVLGATTPGGPQSAPRDAEAEAILRSGGRRGMAGLFFSPAYLDLHPQAYAPRPIAPAMQRLHFRASAAHDAWALLPGIAAPTLVIHGGEDRLNPTANGALLARRIPGAELLILPGARHGFLDECREEALRAVTDFLGRHPLGG